LHVSIHGFAQGTKTKSLQIPHIVDSPLGKKYEETAGVLAELLELSHV
jgi:hypothetical protein